MDGKDVKALKTPEEVKKGQECCANGSCLGCPYRLEKHCVTKKNNDVILYIRQTESENDDLKSRLAQAEREKDAAVAELRLLEDCENCKHRNECKYDGFGYKKCRECGGCPLCEGICIMNIAAYEGEMRCPEDWDIDDWKEDSNEAR